MFENFYREQITESVQSCLTSLYGQLPDQLVWETPPKAEYGNISLVCFSLAKVYKKNPQEIAAKIAAHFPSTTAVSSASALGPYVNFRFHSKAIARYLFDRTAASNALPYGSSTPQHKKKILLEYSSPNANKPLHLGHARNQAIGMFLAKIYQWLGHEVRQVNLINDRGVHICKSMLAYQYAKTNLSPSDVNEKGDHYVGRFYTDYEALKKKDPQLDKKAQLLLQQWEQGDKNTRELWEKMTSWVLAGFEQTYRRAGVHFHQTYRESETYQDGKKHVFDAYAKGLAYRSDDGAYWVSLAEQNLGEKIVLRKDGTSVYITQDINTTLVKYQDFPFDEAWWVVGNEQEHHFRVLFAILHKFSVLPQQVYLEHISYGMVELPDGKMKSREGTTVDMDELYDGLHQEAYAMLTEKGKSDGRDETEMHQTAEFVGKAAVHFYLLKTASSKNILFDRAASLSFDGMTGPYLQYTCARMSNLIKKAADLNIAGTLTEQHWQSLQINEQEDALLRLAVLFPQTLWQAAQEKNPSVLAHYVYDLSRMFNRFYANYPVVKAEHESSQIFRVALTQVTLQIVRSCLELMNIEPLANM